ncbi:MAG: hypothetical protein OCU12_06200 [Methanophagales archaeon]|nr:hypothetical protein [Methanophagales archaeon]
MKKTLLVLILVLAVLMSTGCDEQSVPREADDFVSLMLLVTWASAVAYLVAYPYWKKKS